MRLARLAIIGLGALAGSGCADARLSAVSKGPLPFGGLPAAQTLEGGGQMRVTASGFAKLGARATALVSSELAKTTVCVAEGTQTLVDYCYANDGACTAGCLVHVTPTSVSLSIADSETLNVKLVGNATSHVPARTSVGNLSCAADVTLTGLHADADLAFSIDASTGDLVLQVARVSGVTVDSATAVGCGAAGNLTAFVAPFSTSLEAGLIEDALKPVLQQVLASVLDSGFAATIDVGTLLVGTATNGSLLETRLAPGGYASLPSGGLSYGLITGFNADSDATTRTPALASEPAACVSALAPFDLSAAPFSLPRATRGTFALSPESPFTGSAEPARDVLVGVSGASLSLAGHHAVASGALCLALDSSRLPPVQRDVLDDLLGIPLAEEELPLRVDVRPTQGLGFSIGDGAAAPLLTASLPGLVLDLQVPSEAGFSSLLRLTADVAQGYALQTRRAADTEIEPVSVGITSSSARVDTLDDRYARVPSSAALLASLVDLVFGSVGPGDTRFSGPRIAGQGTERFAFRRVQTSQADFLAIEGDFGATLAGTAAPAPAPLSTTVDASDAVAVRNALRTGGAGLPAVHVTLSHAAALEYSYRLEQGAWHAYATGDTLDIIDRSFAWQGTRTIELRARTVGDDSTTSATTPLSVTIDYAPPTIFADLASVKNGVLTIPARDAVSAGSALERAIGPVGGSVPTRGFTAGSTLPLGALASAPEVMVYVKDEAGHVASARLRLTVGGDAGLSDDAGGPPRTGSGGASGGDSGASPGASDRDSGAAPGASGRDSGAAPGATDAGSADSGDGALASSALAGSDGGCGCRVEARRAPVTVFHLGLALVALSAGLRRSRRRRWR
ncbi:MAG TPA: hypothetical protein VHU80_05040 [Polyangiaceae bacterium]|nr:hypothetical protein [Polyangiaceae bacterium]